MALQFKSAAAVLLVILGVAMTSQAAQADQGQPPKELIQYIRDAKKRGEAEAKIRRQAVAVGWSAATVDQAFIFYKSGKSVEPAVPATVADAAPQTPPPTLVATPSEGSDRTLVPAGASINRGVSDDYLIGAGDTLQIVVWKEPEV